LLSSAVLDVSPELDRKAGTVRQSSTSSVYVPQRSWTNVSFNHQDRAAEEFGSYADAYRRAGRTLFETFERNPELACEADAIPIAFLYRHAAELYLKAIVRRGNDLLSMAGQEQVSIHAVHTLVGLFDDVQPVFKCMSAGWEAERQRFRQLVADLEKDAVLGLNDRSGDMWRYPVRKDDTSHLPEYFAFDIKTFVERLDEFLNMLYGALNDIDSFGQRLYDAQQDNQY
jgi:hypothetical protein